MELKITHFAVGQGLCVLVDFRYLLGYEQKRFLGILDMGTTFPLDNKA